MVGIGYLPGAVLRAPDGANKDHMTSKQVRGSFAVLNANSGQLYRKDQPVYWLKKTYGGVATRPSV